MKTIIRLLVIALFSFAYLSAHSQETYLFHKNWYLSGQIGTATFYGDMSDKKNRLISNTPFSKFYYEDRGFIVSLKYGKEINAYVSTGLTFNGGKLAATSDLLGLYMTSSIYEYGIHSQVNLMNLILGPSSYRPLDIYGTLGFSGLSYRTYTRDLLTDTLVGINDPENPGTFSGTYLSSSAFLMNYGFGIRYRVADMLSVSFETTSHAVFNDKLDAHISDKRSFEGYGLMTLGLTYHFDMSPHAFRSRYPKYTGKSKEPSIKAYNKKKAVVMNTTKNHRRAMKHRFNTQTGRSHFRLRQLFMRTKRNFAK